MYNYDSINYIKYCYLLSLLVSSLLFYLIIIRLEAVAVAAANLIVIFVVKAIKRRLDLEYIPQRNIRFQQKQQ